MGGIVGYVGAKNALTMVLGSLERLGFRKSTSAGIAFQNGKGIEIFKARGKVTDLRSVLPSSLPDARIGLGHIHAGPAEPRVEQYPHPHRSGDIVVVQSGSVENPGEPQTCVLTGEHPPAADADTAVIPQMISHRVRYGRTLMAAIQDAVAQVRGDFALGLMSESHPHTLFALQRGHPLVLGRGDDEYYIASDAAAIPPFSNDVVFLEDGQLCVLTTTGIEFMDLTIPSGRPAVGAGWSPVTTSGRGYEHHVLKEIHEQPAAVHDTFAEWIKDPQSLLDAAGLSMNTTLGLRRLQVAACGTSYHAALVGRFLIERFARLSVDVEIASEYRYRKPIIEQGNLFISLSQSGETADTLAAQREARSGGMPTLAISNAPDSTAAGEADALICTRAGPETGLVSTKTFTAQLTVLILLALALGLRRGTLSLKAADTVRSHLREIPGMMRETLNKDAEVREIAGSLLQKKGFFYLGRGINYPIALEGALKLKEISCISAEAYPAGEIKHGPIALIEEGIPVIVVAPRDDLFDRTTATMNEVSARGGYLVGITDSIDMLPDSVDSAIGVPQTHQHLSPLLNALPLQLLAYHIGVLSGRDVDRPRSLLKSFTDD